MSSIILKELEVQTNILNIPNNVFEHLKLKDLSIRSRELDLVNHKLKQISSAFIKILFETFDLNKLLSIANEYYYDPNVQDFVQEILTSYLVTYNIDVENIGIRMNKLFKELKIIESFDFDLIEANVNKKCNLYIKSIKYKLMNRLEHELFISLYCLNPLRQETVSFVYTYCPVNATPLIITNNDVQSFAQRETNGYYYLIYENIEGVKLFRFIQSCTFEEFLTIYLLVILNLEIANDRFSFTHYNLISDNVMIKQLSKPTQIRFGRGVFRTTLIPIIIDFSKSYVKYRGEIFSTFEYFDKGVDYLSPNFISDSYQLLMSCLDLMKNSNPAVYKEAFYVRSFFLKNYQDIDFDEERKYSFRLPKSFNNISNSSLIDWLINEYHIPMFDQKLGMNANYCNENQECYTKDRLQKITMIKEDWTIPEFYSYILKLNNINDIKRVKTIKFECKDKLYNFIMNYNKEIQDQVKRIRKITFKFLTPEEVFDKYYLKLQDVIADLLYELQTIDIINYKIRISNYLSSYCNVEKVLTIEYKNELNMNLNYLMHVTDEMIKLISNLEDYVNTNFEEFIKIFVNDLEIGNFWNIVQIFKCIVNSKN
jgi:hypothetical protein